jgi:hypothetical protein
METSQTCRRAVHHYIKKKKLGKSPTNIHTNTTKPCYQQSNWPVAKESTRARRLCKYVMRLVKTRSYAK